MHRPPDNITATSNNTPIAETATSHAPSNAKPGPEEASLLAFSFASDLTAATPTLTETRILLHVGDGPGADAQVDLWYPQLLASGVRFLVVLRSKPAYELILATRYAVPLVYVKGSREAELLVSACSSLKGILYAANTGTMIHFIRFGHCQHIWIGHGEIEKPASCHKLYRVYDEIWTAGLARVDRFRDAGIDFGQLKYRIIGRPSLRWWTVAAMQPGTHGRFGYLPTWEGLQKGQRYTSLELAQPLLQQACAITGLAPVIKLHPWTGNQIAKLEKIDSALEQEFAGTNTGLNVIPRTGSPWDLMGKVDFLVADISAVVTDFLATQRPLFVFMPGNRELQPASSRPSLQDCAYMFSTVEELATLLQRVIVDGKDDLAKARLDVFNYRVSLQQTLHEGFAVALRDVAGAINLSSLGDSLLRKLAGPTLEIPAGLVTPPQSQQSQA